MTNYRRNRIPGGTYCFTVNLLDRRSRLLVDRIDALRAAVRHVRKARPFHIDAWVVLPEHMHCLLTLPDGDADYSTRLRLIKTKLSRSVAAGEARSPSRAARKERGIWQRRFWEHTIRDDADYAAHMDYIHFNPVHHGLTTSAADWEFSTFRRCVALGMYPADWAVVGPGTIDVGERNVGWVSEA
jgi:putative transposase